MSPLSLQPGSVCRVIDVNGSEAGSCLFMGLEIHDNRWHYNVLKDEKVQDLNVANFTLVPLVNPEQIDTV